MTLKNTPKPWFAKSPSLHKNAHIAVIGGGISGITTAYHLKQNGYNVILIEKNNDIMSAASGNPAAILYPYISSETSIKKDFYLNAYSYAIDFYKKLGNNIFTECPLIKIPQNEEDKKRFKKILKSYPSNLLHIENDRLVFTKGGYIKPSHIIQTLKEKLHIILNSEITHLTFKNDNKWALYSKEHNVLNTDAIVICNSHDILNFNQTKHLSLEKKSGQISYLKPDYSDPFILSSEGYLTPPIDTEIGIANLCGSTFERNNSLKITEKAHKKNIHKCPITIDESKVIGGRRGIRAMTPDHMPILGAVANYDYFQSEYADIHHGSRHKKFPPALYHPYLYVNVGLGARGFLTAPYLANLLCSQISGTSFPLNEKIREILHPARFIIKKLSKRLSVK